MKNCCLTVSPDTLDMCAADVLQKIEKAQNAFQQMDSCIEKISGYGKNCDEKSVYKSPKDDYEHIFQALREHANEWQSMIFSYRNPGDFPGPHFDLPMEVIM